MLETTTCPQCGNDFARLSESSADFCDDCRRANEPAPVPSAVTDARENGTTDQTQDGSPAGKDSRVSSTEDDLRVMLQRVERKIDDERNARQTTMRFALLLSLSFIIPYGSLGLANGNSNGFPFGIVLGYAFVASNAAVFSIWLAISLRTLEEKLVRLGIVFVAWTVISRVFFGFDSESIFELTVQFVFPFSFACFTVAQALGILLCIAMKPPSNRYRSVPRGGLIMLFVLGAQVALLLATGRMLFQSNDLMTYLISATVGGMLGLILTSALGATHECDTRAKFMIVGIIVQVAILIPVLMYVLFFVDQGLQAGSELAYALFMAVGLATSPMATWALMRKFGHEVVRERRVPPAVKLREEVVDPFQ